MRLWNPNSEIIYAAKGMERTIHEWHTILGHTPVPVIARMARNKLVDDLNIIGSHDPIEQCVPCIRSKQHLTPFPSDTHLVAKEVGDLICSDLWGPAQVESLNHEQYAISFTDVKSRKSSLMFLKDKDSKGVLKTTQQYVAYVERQTKRKVKRIHVDNGTEYNKLSASIKLLWKRLGPQSWLNLFRDFSGLG